MVSVLKGHLNIKNKTIPAILAQETDVACSNNSCAPTPALTATYLRATVPAKHAKIMQVIAADTKMMLKYTGKSAGCLVRRKATMKGEATERKNKNQIKFLFFLKITMMINIQANQK